MNITIFGCGFVGGTVANFLEEKYEGEIKTDSKAYKNFVKSFKGVFKIDG